MLSNSQTLFEQISKALYRAAMFISNADLTGGEKAWHEEMKAIDVVQVDGWYLIAGSLIQSYGAAAGGG